MARRTASRTEHQEEQHLSLLAPQPSSQDSSQPLSDSSQALININDLADIGERGTSSNNQMISALQKFRLFLSSTRFHSFDTNVDEFKASFDQEVFGKFGTYLVEHTTISWNTAHNYIGCVKTFLEEELGIQIFQGSWYEKLRKKITKKFMEKAKENGSKLVNSADSLDKEDLTILCDALSSAGKHVERLLLIMQFQAIGRISEVTCASFTDLSWNESSGYVTFDISRQKTGVQGLIHIFVDSMGHSTDFLHALASVLVTKMYFSAKLFPDVGSSAAAYMNRLLKQTQEIIQMEHKKLTSHSSRRGAPTYAASNSDIQVQWVAMRGGWLMDAVNRVFVYISNTSQEDCKVGRSLSGWDDIKRGGVAPGFENEHALLDKIELICHDIFGVNNMYISSNMAKACLASLLCYFHETDSQVQMKIQRAARKSGIDQNSLMELCQRIRSNFVTKNLLSFPRNSKLLRGAQIGDLTVDFDTWREFQTKSIRVNEMFMHQLSLLQQDYNEQKLVNIRLQRSVSELIQVVRHLSSQVQVTNVLSNPMATNDGLRSCALNDANPQIVPISQSVSLSIPESHNMSCHNVAIMEDTEEFTDEQSAQEFPGDNDYIEDEKFSDFKINDENQLVSLKQVSIAAAFFLVEMYDWKNSTWTKYRQNHSDIMFVYRFMLSFLGTDIIPKKDEARNEHEWHLSLHKLSMDLQKRTMTHLMDKCKNSNSVVKTKKRKLKSTTSYSDSDCTIHKVRSMIKTLKEQQKQEERNQTSNHITSIQPISEVAVEHLSPVTAIVPSQNNSCDTLSNATYARILIEDHLINDVAQEGLKESLGIRMIKFFHRLFYANPVNFLRNYASPENGFCFYRSVAFLLDMDIESVHRNFFDLLRSGEMFFSGLENEDERSAAELSLDNTEENRPTIAHILAISKLLKIHFLILKTETRILTTGECQCLGFMQFISNDILLRKEPCPSNKILCLHLRSLNDATARISNGHYEPVTIDGQKAFTLSDPIASKFQPNLAECAKQSLGHTIFSYSFQQ